MGRIMVDGFSRHGGDLVVVLSSFCRRSVVGVAVRKDADNGRSPSNAGNALHTGADIQWRRRAARRGARHARHASIVISEAA
jgi:hypothetical protein